MQSYYKLYFCACQILKNAEFLWMFVKNKKTASIKMPYCGLPAEDMIKELVPQSLPAFNPVNQPAEQDYTDRLYKSDQCLEY